MCSEFQNATEEDQYFRHHGDGRTRTVTQIKTIFQKCQRLKVGISTETYGSNVILKANLKNSSYDKFYCYNFALSRFGSLYSTSTCIAPILQNGDFLRNLLCVGAMDGVSGCLSMSTGLL